MGIIPVQAWPEQEKLQRQERGLPTFGPVTERDASLWTNMRKNDQPLGQDFDSDCT